MEEKLPEFQTEFGTQMPYQSTKGNSVLIQGTNLDEYDRYLNAMTQAGYHREDWARKGNRTFSVLSKNDQSVWTSFCSELSEARLIFGESDPTPDIKIGKKSTQPLLIQPIRKGVYQTAPGMSYCIRLSDGKFILIDGGPHESADTDSLFQLLREKAGDPEHISIAAWIFTHAHVDHMGVAMDFLKKYGKMVDIEYFFAGFPDFEKIEMVYERPEWLDYFVKLLEKMRQENCPTAIFHTLHPGETIRFAGCEMKVLTTSDDLFPVPYYTGNHTSCAFEMMFDGGKKITFLGDCEVPLCEQMEKMYGETLKSDILQVTHHGFNGATLGLYQLINPDICLWACDDRRFWGKDLLVDGKQDRRCTGEEKHYEFNAWIRNDLIKKRLHKHNCENCEIMLLQ